MLKRHYMKGHQWANGAYHADTGMWQGLQEALGRPEAVAVGTHGTDAGCYPAQRLAGSQNGRRRLHPCWQTSTSISSPGAKASLAAATT